jgi:hypothetical protein
MRVRHVIGMLTFAACVASAGNAPPKAKPAMDELWRRGTCVLSSIVVPAQKASRVPKNLGGAKQIVGRPVSRAGGYRCFVTAGDTLYVATDTRLDVFDLASGKRTASFTPADGLPDAPIDELVVDGPRVWAVARTGLGLVEGGKATAKGLPQFRVARVVPARESVWVVADSGTFVRDRTGGAWRSLPALPTARTIASQLDRGIWQERWRSATGMMIAQAAATGDRLWVVSMGSLCRFDGKWTQVSRDAWTLAADGEALWVLTSKGVECYHGDKVTRYGKEQGLAEGRHRRIAVTERAVWVATDGRPDPKTKQYVGGGLSRFDRAKGTWSAVTRINNLPVTDISCLAVRDGRLWVSSLVFAKLVVRSAHPGMMHVRRAVPEVTGVGIHHCDLATEQWQSVNCPHPEGQPRQILGQRGKALAGRLVPYRALAVAPGKTRLIAMVEMQDPTYYGGRCHSVVSLAQREAPGKPWAAAYEDLTVQTGHEGEQPDVLLLSESHGKRIVFATGQPRALYVGVHGGRVWALGERALACETDKPGTWNKVAETQSRFYWDASAAVATKDTLWIGGDAGTISRLDTETMDCRVLACLKRRRIERLAADGEGRLWVRSRPAKVVLPTDLKNVPAIEAKDVMVFNGKTWQTPNDGFPKTESLPWSCKGNVLQRGGQRVFLRGVFKPQPLCEDGAGNVWVKVYENLVRVPVGDAK